MSKNSENIIEVIDELKESSTQNNQSLKIQLDEINKKLEDIGDGKEFVYVRNTLTDLKNALSDRFNEISEAIANAGGNVQSDSQIDMQDLFGEKFQSAFDTLDQNLNGLVNNLSSMYDKFKLETGENFTELKDDLQRVAQTFSVEKLEILELSKTSDANSEKLSSMLRQGINDVEYEIKDRSKDLKETISEKIADLKAFFTKETPEDNGNISDELEKNFSKYCTKINEIADIIVNLKDGIKEKGDEYKESVNAFSSQLDVLNNDFNTAYSNLSDEVKMGINERFDSFQKFITKNIVEYEEQVSGIEENLKSEFVSLENDIREKFSTIVGAIDRNSALFDRCSEFFSAFIKRIDSITGKDYVENFNTVMEQNSKTQELVQTLHTKVDELLTEVSDKEENTSLINKHLSDLEEKVVVITSAIGISRDDEILELNVEIEELIKGIDKKVNDIKPPKIQELLPDIASLFEKTENRLNFLIEDFKENEAEKFEELNKNITNQKSLLDELNAKLDVFAASDNNALLEEELQEIKDIILAQEEILKSDNSGITKKAEDNFKNIISKIDDLVQSLSDHEDNSEKIKENIIETIISVFNNTGFTEESEDIKEFVEEKTDELNKQIHDVKNQLKTIQDSDLADYSYTLSDVEHDMANLRGAIKDVTATTPVTEINQISRNIHNLTSSIDAISKNLTPAEIFQLKHGILKLNDDILSISSRTNKLLMNSDEASKTITDGVEAFNHIAYNLEERIKEFSNHDLVVQMADKLERVLMLAENSSSSDATVQKVLMFLGEWVDAVSETFENINTKTDEIKSVSDVLSDLRKSLPQKSELFDMLEERFEEQQTRIDRLEAKLNSVADIVQQNSTSTVITKIERLENLVDAMNNSIEKLTSYVE